MHLFVYGTLKMGEGNHRLMGDSPLIGTFATKLSFVMSGRGFPFIFPSNQPYAGKVVGEIYDVKDEKILRNIDALEGHPTWYVRRPFMFSNLDTGEILSAEAYINPQAMKGSYTESHNGYYIWNSERRKAAS